MNATATTTATQASTSYAKAHRATRILIQGMVQAHGDDAVRGFMATAKVANHEGAARAYRAMAQQSFINNQWALANIANDAADREQGKRDAWTDYQATAPKVIADQG